MRRGGTKSPQVASSRRIWRNSRTEDCKRVSAITRSRRRPCLHGRTACGDHDAASPALSYALVTPVLDEFENLARLAASVESQTWKPCRWMIVESRLDRRHAQAG